MLKPKVKSNDYNNATYVMCIIIASLIIALILCITPNLASAVSYQSSSDIEFTFSPTITISITGSNDGNLVIPNLVPGDYQDSNIITITASSNAVAGYTLTSTVGDSTNASNELRKDGTNTTNKFTSITSNKASLSTFDDNANTWGYSYCNDTNDCTDTTNWISGDITITDPSSSLYPTTGYNGYTYDTTTSTSDTITHLSSTTSGSSTIKYKIGARSTTTQLAGEYTNVINFTAVANANPEWPIYMQNLDPSLCTTEPRAVVDNRDNEVYIIQRLADNNCWMMMNLNLGATPLTNDLTSSNTSIASGSAITALAFSSWNRSTSGIENSYTDPKFSPASGIDSKSGTPYGTLYNYCAASAKTYCMAGGSGSGDASYDLCPAGWRLPTGSSSSEFATLYTNYNTNSRMRAPINDGGAAFALAGCFDGSSPMDQGSYGKYWSSTRYNGYNMYRLYLNGTNVDLTDASVVLSHLSALRIKKRIF